MLSKKTDDSKKTEGIVPVRLIWLKAVNAPLFEPRPRDTAQKWRSFSGILIDRVTRDLVT